MKKTDVVIIGAGIAGITTAIYLKRAGIDFVLLEGKVPGGKLPQISKIENYPGYVSTSGLELQLQLLEQLKHLNISITYGIVQSILKEPTGFEVISDVNSYETKVVVVATGTIMKSGGIKGERDFVGKGVSYCATCDGNFFKGLDVVVYGNNDIALEEALYLSNLASKVTLIVKDNELAGDPSLIKQVNSSSKIDVRLSTDIKEIKGDEYGVTEVITSKDESIPTYGVFPYSGNKTSADFLSTLKPISENGYIKVDETMMSNIPGLFAIGDVVNKKLRQLVNAAGEGATASHYIVSYLKGLK